ncbi:MAG: hypothetical protein SFU56_15045 [Capsulimonadales bacterium]|nr:hypothetical protein [Capsulimonadales bacterium]
MTTRKLLLTGCDPLGSDDHSIYNDNQDGVHYDEYDNSDLLTDEELAAHRDPDRYTRMIDKDRVETVWKAVAKFERRAPRDCSTREISKEAEAASCVRWDEAERSWSVEVERGGIAFDFGRHDNVKDAMAFAIEAIRCLHPNVRLSESGSAHLPEAVTLQGVAVIVATVIAGMCDATAIPPRVKAIFLLQMLYHAGGQFEQNHDGVWQLWHEEGDEIDPVLITHASESQHEVADVLDNVWSDFHSYKIDRDRYPLNVPQRV